MFSPMILPRTRLSKSNSPSEILESVPDSLWVTVLTCRKPHLSLRSLLKIRRESCEDEAWIYVEKMKKRKRSLRRVACTSCRSLRFEKKKKKTNEKPEVKKEKSV